MDDGDRCSSSTPVETRERVEKDGDEEVLRFMDSLDTYLMLLDSLSSTLRQGWFELASARHSMGSSRISSVMLDQNVQSAATTLQVREFIDRTTPEPQTIFSLSKLASSTDERCSSEEIETTCVQRATNSSELRHRGSSNLYDGTRGLDSTTTSSLTIRDSNIQKERSKLLSVFGTLVSPKLRAAQVSFETAIDDIVAIANIRSSLLSSFSQLQQEMKDLK
ncbi:hypothetical protein Cni_G14502 [Canna indica]|uniref:Vacuolar ATPase assembly protein VMA22 n=1 Tax=Canna indica TaxID=4628 RepID=A0AAQ3KHZ2_9LILI|nr:hypothetical protein Cni_G14502 [Canna indica]